MNSISRWITGLALTLVITSSATAGGEPPSADEMWRIIQSQQREIEALKGQLRQTDQKAEAAAETADEVSAASAKTAWASKTQVGGYGELHYNNLDGSGGAGDKDEIDFHRAVLFFGHQFNDRIRFFSEIEYEHADTGRNGEVELEQAYLEFDLNNNHRARGGLFLVPAGILNETHEPPTFYGVERNPVEKNIIPTTWWVGGAGLRGEFARGWSYDLALHEGLDTSAGDSYAIRAGRQKTSEAIASDLAYTGRLKWTGMPGLELAATAQYQEDITQGSDPNAGNAKLYEVHAIWNRGPFNLRALYALWDLDGSGPRAIGADEQEGFYIEPSWKFNDKLGIFVRYNQWDNAAGSSSDSEKKQYDAGINYWPHQDVVLKADYMKQNNEDGREQDGFNLGVGFQF